VRRDLLCLLAGAVLLICLSRSSCATDTGRIAGVSWTTQPAYESATPAATPFQVRDDTGLFRTLYDRSYAVLILEGQYQAGSGFAPVVSAASRSEILLRKKLEDRGFHVLVWRDLRSRQLKDTLDDVFSTLGYKSNSRFFFYYFGHGHVIGTVSDPAGPRTFLVPIDAPNWLNDEEGFERSAVPITQVLAYANQATFKHAFFAFEACQAGAIVASLDGPRPPRPKGYLLSTDLLQPVRQFLTAGNNVQEVPADNSFTTLLAGAMSDPTADINKDGYITGNELINYVATNLPQWTASYPLSPEHGSLPRGTTGDFVFGPLNPQNAPSIPTSIPVGAPLNTFGNAIHGARIAVSTEPSRSEIYLDGNYMGFAPMTLDDLSATQHKVRLQLSGFQPRDLTVNLTAGQTFQLNGIALDRIPPVPVVAPSPVVPRHVETLESRKETRGMYWDGGSAGKIQAQLRQAVEADLKHQCTALGGIAQAPRYDRECDSGDKDDCVYDGGGFTSHLTCTCSARMACVIGGR
jgi:PEGA domain